MASSTASMMCLRLKPKRFGVRWFGAHTFCLSNRHFVATTMSCRFPCLKYNTKNLFRKILTTRMHSSRMRTGRSLTVCRSQLPGGGGVSAPGRCLLWGVSAPGGCLLWGVSAPERGLLWGVVCIPGCTEAETPLWTESQTPVKNITLAQLRCGR